jgi:hypothetical protein
MADQVAAMPLDINRTWVADGYMLTARIATKPGLLIVRNIPEHKLEGVERAIGMAHRGEASVDILNSFKSFGIKWD